MTVRALFLCVLALATAPPTPGVAQSGEGAGPGDSLDIRGTVVDRETHQVIEGVAVTLRPAGDGADTLAARRSGFTDADGRFTFGGLANGFYQIALQRIGYQSVVDSVGFRADMGLRIEVEMVSDAVELDPLLVATEARSRSLEASGFYDRRRRGIGRFVARNEAVLRNALMTSDVFRHMAGVRMSSTGRFGNRGVVLLRGGCVADVYMDGVRTIRPFELDALVQPGDLDAIEVYHGSEVPPQFGTTTCGAVVLWTHTPNPGTGRPWSWKKFLVAAGLLGSSILIFR